MRKALKRLNINVIWCSIESVLMHNYKHKGLEHEGTKTY